MNRVYSERYKRAVRVYFYILILVLGGSCIMGSLRIQELTRFYPFSAEIAGSDRVVWKNTPNGVVAEAIHPLLRYQQQAYIEARIPEYILAGDRLKKIDYSDIYSSGIVDTITQNAPPGKIFIFQIERKNKQTFRTEINEPFVVNAHRLSFSFNENGVYWQITLWGIVLGTTGIILIVLILFPLIQGRKNENRLLRGMEIMGVLFFGLQGLRYLWWIIQTDATNIQFEKAFILLYIVLGGVFAILYWIYESEENRLWIMGVSFGLLLLYALGVFRIIYIEQKLKFYHEWIESVTFLWIYFHILFANLWGLVFKEKISFREKILRTGLGLLSGWNLFFWGKNLLFPSAISIPDTELWILIFGFVQFVPAVSVASVHLKFGKVSLVLTRSIQYLILFVTVLIVSFATNQLFGYFLPGNPYRQILEIVVDIILVLTLRGIYLSNEAKIRRYFILSQQQKEEQIRAFSALIPQFTATEKLYNATLNHLKAYLETENITIFWEGDLGFGIKHSHQDFTQEVFSSLEENQTIWAANKEISPHFLPQTYEVMALEHTLIFPISVNEENIGLLMIGKKKRGVYNLTDVEVVGQLIQQIRLTLNVLHLVQREKALLAQTYQANLTVLRSQINPHFLFNTLNTISALIHESPDLAEEAVEKLAFIFRYTLKTSDKNFVPFADEMRLVKTYLQIEQIRFGKRLEANIDIQKEAEDVEIPAFVIQTIIENCIKHGIAKIVNKGLISIKAHLEEDVLLIQIYDNGPGIDQDRIRKGTGLNNIITRIENIYHNQDSIRFENVGNGTRVTLSIPKNPVLEQKF